MPSYALCPYSIQYPWQLQIYFKGFTCSPKLKNLLSIFPFHTFMLRNPAEYFLGTSLLMCSKPSSRVPSYKVISFEPFQLIRVMLPLLKLWGLFGKNNMWFLCPLFAFVQQNMINIENHSNLYTLQDVHYYHSLSLLIL